VGADRAAVRHELAARDHRVRRADRALAAAWLTRWRYRLFFLFLAIVGVFVTAGVFPVHSPTPFGRMLLNAYRSVPGAAGLRTTYKFASGLN
jgi:hypothetical protein